MAQVIIVSNRLPVSVSKEDGKLVFSASLGGLATGLSSYVSDRRNVWIGWPGIASDELSETDKQTIVAELARQNYRPVFLSKRQLDDFYNGYSNNVLWPLFHKLNFHTDSEAGREKWWQAYRSVNRLYAEAVFNTARRDSQIWVHDYQLLMLPEMLRSELTYAQVGFFLHIPFPTAAALSKLPEAGRLLRGMLGADLIGFHTLGYVDAFLECCQALTPAVAGTNQVVLGGHVVRVGEFPMGIDYERYATAGKSRLVRAAARRYRRKYRGQKVIVAVDRMDPSKGLVERLKAYREFLERNARLRGKVVFAMIAAPSRTEIAAYQNLAKRLDKLVRDINAEFGTDKWQPIDYMNASQPFEEVTALFQIADVAFIAPLRDGMNLAAKEFIASNRKRGVLILSETAGAASELHDALLVNPRQLESLVGALQQATTMRRRELRSRLRRMQRQLSVNTVHSWAKGFVETLQQPLPGTRRRVLTLRGPWETQLIDSYRSARKRLLLLDYDGTLVPFSEDYMAAKPRRSLLNLLGKLAADKQNEVVLVSGRSADDLDKWFGDLGLNLIGEHGAVTKKAGHKNWQTAAKGETKWKQAIEPTLQKYADLVPRARVEVKPHSLVWHYRGAPAYDAQKYSVIIKRVLKPVLKAHGLQIFQGSKILEIKDPRTSKGMAVQSWLKQRADFVLAAGDDFTDEELFAVLPETAWSIRVGRGRTQARYRLGYFSEVLNLLRKLTR